MHITRLAAACVALLFAAACAADDSARLTVMEQDSAGIVIMENAGPYPAWRAAPEPLLRLGTVAGDAVLRFHRIVFAARLGNGSVVVVDGGSSTVRWFGADGAHHATAGGSGEGPGEFRNPGSTLLTPGDSLVVHDPGLRRVSLFSPEGTYVRGLSVAEVPSGTLSLFGVGPEGVLGIAVSMPTWEDPRAQYTFTGDTLAILIHAAAGLDTLGWRRGTERAIWAAFEGGSVSSVAQTRHPYAHSVLIGATQRTVFVADALGHQVEIRDWAGTLQSLARRLDAPPAVLGSEERARYVASRVAAAEARGASNMAELEQATEELLAVLPQDHTVPPFDRLLTTSEGRLWLRDFVAPASQGSEQRWVVYDAEGRVVRMVAVPAEVTVMHVSEEHVTGVMRDSLDVEYVVVHRLERGS